MASPQQDDLRLLGPPLASGADGEARTRDRRVPADLRADSQATLPPTPLLQTKKREKAAENQLCSTNDNAHFSVQVSIERAVSASQIQSHSVAWSVGGLVDSKTALRSAGNILLRVEPHHRCPSLAEDLKA
ncbi:hypothetical protein PoB_000156800 [Plakobranchus ocellatus]|uniref:Uncharacterized protein n=1 Tax=Plakobranchus ocellatus TaxID=259542 RepID=A0AAV3XXG9_9GAST|nr:hypothetical protein PoB_000156800 [Plakobranchus ocellatus]